MTASTSRLAYDDAYECYDRALKNEFGIRIRFESRQDMVHFRSRLNVARGIDRKENREIYPREHPMHGVSQYDRVTCRLRQIDGVWWLYMLPIMGAGALEIEPLTSFDIPASPQSPEYQLSYNGLTPLLEPARSEIIEPLRPKSEPTTAAIPQSTITIRRRL